MRGHGRFSQTWSHMHSFRIGVVTSAKVAGTSNSPKNAGTLAGQYLPAIHQNSKGAATIRVVAHAQWYM